MENLIAVVPHRELKTFLQESSKKKGVYKTLYLVLATLAGMCLGGLVSFSLVVWILDGTSTYAAQVGLAILFSLTVLVLIHEGIHGLAYKLSGATNVYYGANIRQFVFYAASDGDVFTGRQFRTIAFAPFVLVTVLCLALMLFLPQYLFLSAIILSLHTLFCGGDFMFIHFLSQYDLQQVRTHDNREKSESYFYYVD